METYNKDAIDAKLEAIHAEVKEIHGQVVRTNGRVTTLEKWRWTITGIAITAAIMGIPNFTTLAKVLAGI